MNDLYMVIMGCKPPNRFVEQHDVFFGISSGLIKLKPQILNFWPEGERGLHIDAYRIVRKVGNYEIGIIERKDNISNHTGNIRLNLYFLNLGGYKANDMEEYHYKQLVVAKSMEEAIVIATENTFWKHHESPHIDNKYGIDVDDAYLVEDLLPAAVRSKYAIQIRSVDVQLPEDDIVVGYLELDKLI